MWRSAACLAFVLTASGTAAAQDHGTVGITMAFPASIGMIFHVTDKVAVRPDVAFNRNSTDTTTVDATSWTLGTDVSALFYLSSQDRVQTYISPRFSYTHSDSSAVGTTAIPGSSTNGSGFAGSFGAQYSPSAKFSVFGEIGIGYTHATSKSGLTGLELTNNTWGTRAGVGIVFCP
jgi:hypothetical protein